MINASDSYLTRAKRDRRRTKKIKKRNEPFELHLCDNHKTIYSFETKQKRLKRFYELRKTYPDLKLIK